MTTSMTEHKIPTLDKMQVDELDLVASICKDSFYDFVQEFWSIIIPEKPIWNWHIEYLCNELQYIAERVFSGKPREYNLIINISPSSTKSTIASVMFPAWIWARMPSARVIGGSYEAGLAFTLALKNRDILLSEKYQKCYGMKWNKIFKKWDYWVRIRPDQSAKTKYANTRGGWRFSVGTGGSITGQHGHFLIIDDPLDPSKTVSETELKAANRWMSEVLPSRMVDMNITPIILIMQRLHQDDPTANLLERARKSGMPIKHICLPAEDGELVNPPELRKFYVDGLMDPVRLSKKILNEKRADGMFSFSGQYLQNPIPLGAEMFDVHLIQTRMPPERFIRLCRYWDKAATQDDGCFTVGVLMGVDIQGRFWILDVVRGQWNSAKREMIIKQTADMDYRKYGRDVLIRVEQEPGSGGKESAEATIKNLAGFRCQADRPTGDKIQRADPFSYQVNVGNVLIVPGEWNKVYLDELQYFPNSKYKDQTDATSGAFATLFKKRKKVGGMFSKNK